MANVERPEVKNLISTAKKQLEDFKNIIDSESKEQEAVRLFAQALFDDRLKTSLEEMDVEHLSKGKQGIRVALLRNKGYTNMCWFLFFENIFECIYKAENCRCIEAF